MAFAAARMILKDKNRRKSKEDFPAAQPRTRSKVQHYTSTIFHYDIPAVFHSRMTSHCNLQRSAMQFIEANSVKM